MELKLSAKLNFWTSFSNAHDRDKHREFGLMKEFFEHGRPIPLALWSSGLLITCQHWRTACSLRIALNEWRRLEKWPIGTSA